MSNKYWDLIIKPKSGWFDIDLEELWKYRDLMFLFVKRDFVTFYKQTILGPLWYIIQPLFNTIVFTIIFGKVAKIPTDSIPPFLFYLSGTVVWGYFAQCLTATSDTFIANTGIFGKVYFPRLIVPFSAVITGIFQFLIQFTIFLGFFFYYWYQDVDISPNGLIFLLPLVVLQMAFLGLGVGVLISSLTTKYRDLKYALTFGIQLWMFLSPVVYPLSQIPEQYRIFYVFNPMVSVIELFRKAFLGHSSILPIHIVISVTVTIFFLILGIVLFSKIERNFMDTI